MKRIFRKLLCKLGRHKWSKFYFTYFNGMDSSIVIYNSQTCFVCKKTKKHFYNLVEKEELFELQIGLNETSRFKITKWPEYFPWFCL